MSIGLVLAALFTAAYAHLAWCTWEQGDPDGAVQLGRAALGVVAGVAWTVLR